METQKRAVDKHARHEFTVAEARLKAKDLPADPQAVASDPGWVEGYALVWDKIDLMGDIMQRGCCARSIAQAVPAGLVKLMTRHYRDGGDVLELIGTINQAKEDDYGLWIHADFDPEEAAQAMRGKVLRNEIKFMSGGFMALQSDQRKLTDAEREYVLPSQKNKLATIYTEIKFMETTLTVKPVNEGAVVTGAKTLPADNPLNEGLVAAKKQPAKPNPAAAPDTGLTAGGTQGKSLEPPPPPAPPASPALKRDLVLKKARMSVLSA